MTKNMAAVMYEVGDVRLEERPMPKPGPHEVLVQVTAVGVCGSDVHYYRHGRIGSFVVERPIILGHESAGVIVELGSEARKHRIGARVALEPGVPCGRCEVCRSGHYNLCPHVQFFATPPIDGAFTNFVTIHEDFAFALPNGMSDEAGGLLEPMSVGIWAAKKADIQCGQHVLITGAGPIGMVSMMAAFAFGATEVTMTDISEERLAFARKLGATHTINVASTPLLDEAIEVDAFIECSGNPSALQDGIRCIRPAGRAAVVGMGGGDEASVPLSLIQTREITLAGVFRYANTYPTAIELVSSGKVNLDALVTGRYSLAETDAVLRQFGKEPANVKPVILPQE
ncbi:NAD(P)-dependent alcohol dehydrogenase [Alicyclobacillus fodiniaquatilis]|jgi:L-iditol 2-dehydrogenase|uniref:NAD(P)-dependent alcohol dehydrogenase n=1 Tax=Alicyclobacillus fodiniaquatilis TaxID=1661150 RepID=A0ABW4JG43_9BACL